MVNYESLCFWLIISIVINWNLIYDPKADQYVKNKSWKGDLPCSSIKEFKNTAI